MVNNTTLVSGLGGTPSQVWGLPHLRSRGVPHLRSGGVPHLRSGGGTPPQNSKHLLWLHGGQYASCVQAGGLSYFIKFFW